MMLFTVLMTVDSDRMTGQSQQTDQHPFVHQFKTLHTLKKKKKDIE